MGKQNVQAKKVYWGPGIFKRSLLIHVKQLNNQRGNKYRLIPCNAGHHAVFLISEGIRRLFGSSESSADGFILLFLKQGFGGKTCKEKVHLSSTIRLILLTSCCTIIPRYHYESTLARAAFCRTIGNPRNTLWSPMIFSWSGAYSDWAHSACTRSARSSTQWK